MNLEEIKKKLLAVTERNSGSGVRPWRPKGEHQVRLFHAPGYEEPFVERSYHYDIGDEKTILCPRCFGDECAICDLAEKFKSWKDENGVDKPEARRKEEFEIFRKLQPRTRYWTAMTEIGKESEGAKWWSITENSYKQILEICANADFNEDHAVGGSAILTDPDRAVNLTVDFKKPGERGNNKTFPETTIKPRMKFSKLEGAAKILSTLPKLDDLDPRVPSDVVAKKFKAAMAKGTDEGEVDQKVTREYGGGEKKPEQADEEPKKAASNNAEKLVGTRSVDEALNDIMNS